MITGARILLVLLLGTLLGCSRPGPAGELHQKPEGPLAQESFDVSFQISEKGVVRLILDAAHMLRYEHPDSVYSVFERSDSLADRVKATFFDSTGERSGTLTAERVLFDEVDHSMIATGDVVLTAGQGRKLQTERLVWNENERTIAAPDFVSMTTEDQQIRGYDLEANEDLSTWTLKKPSGTVRIRE